MSHKISYRERGQGPILLLLHGYGGSVHHWEAIIENLSREYRVVTLNLSHIYLSADKLFFSVQVETVARFVRDTFPNQTVHLAGLSYGGALAWGLACQHKDLVKRVVLINPMVANPVKHFMPRELKFFFSIPLNLTSVYVMLSTPMGRAFLKRAAQIFRDERSEGAIAAQALSGRKLLFVAHMIHHFSWILRSEDWSVWTQKLKAYQGNCRLIFDKEDLLFNPQAYQEFAKEMGCEDVVLLTGAGHLAIKTQPERVGMLIKEFLNNRVAA